MDKIIKRLGNLLSVKSLVTLTLTAVFAYMAVVGKISQDFMTVYAVVIAFYFGTQTHSRRSTIERADARRNGSSSTTSAHSALRPAWPSGSKTRRPEPARTTP